MKVTVAEHTRPWPKVRSSSDKMASELCGRIEPSIGGVEPPQEHLSGAKGDPSVRECQRMNASASAPPFQQYCKSELVDASTFGSASTSIMLRSLTASNRGAVFVSGWLSWKTTQGLVLGLVHRRLDWPRGSTLHVTPPCGFAMLCVLLMNRADIEDAKTR